ncbi:Sulphatase-modifying factor domain protein, partial [Candidatus Magnetomorum sp. HK-1]
WNKMSTPPNQTPLNWLQQFTDKAHIKQLLYVHTAKIYHEAGHYTDEARCLALAGKYDQAAEIYLTNNQPDKGINCLINCQAYEKALKETQKWIQSLNENDVSGHVKSRLYLSCCLIKLNKDENQAKNVYLEAREIIAAEEYRQGCLAGNIWESLAIYGNYISRDDLIRIGYEKALAHYENCNKSEWQRTIKTYIETISFDRILVYELKNQLESRFSKEEDGSSIPQTITNSIGMTFVLIPAGVFMMGSPEDEPERLDREVLHEVTLTQPYYMQTTQVTQGQWETVMGNNPSYFKDGGHNCPVEQVSWEDAQEFIKQLNTLEGTEKYRLPGEAEWEYACRAGTSGPFYFGKCLSTDQA